MSLKCMLIHHACLGKAMRGGFSPYSCVPHLVRGSCKRPVPLFRISQEDMHEQTLGRCCTLLATLKTADILWWKTMKPPARTFLTSFLLPSIKWIYANCKNIWDCPQLLAWLVVMPCVEWSCLGYVKRISSICTVVCFWMSLWWSGGYCFKLV